MKGENDSLSYMRVDLRNTRSDEDKGTLHFNADSEPFRLPKEHPYPPSTDNPTGSQGRHFVCAQAHCHENSSCLKNELSWAGFQMPALSFHPVDRLRWCEQAFPDILRFIAFIAVGELPGYRVSFNQRYILNDGSSSQFLHEGYLAYARNSCFPVLNLKVFSEIGDMKTDEAMILTISRYSPDDGYQKVFTKRYGESGSSQLSQREKEILRLCLEGLSSKRIASRLNLSIHTVKNHKRHCMEKTFTHTIAELIHLCYLNQWL